MKYNFTLKGAIWWERTSHQPFDLSHVVFINQAIDANNAAEAIRSAKKIIKDLREENPSRDRKDYGVKAELFLGTPGQPLWEYRFAKGKARKEYWEKRRQKRIIPETYPFTVSPSVLSPNPLNLPDRFSRKAGLSGILFLGAGSVVVPFRPSLKLKDNHHKGHKAAGSTSAAFKICLKSENIVLFSCE